MELTSEQVHWIFGSLLVAASAVFLLRDTGRLGGRWLDYLLPVLLVLFGIEMLLDPLVHGDAAPANYAAETAQHFALGLLLIATSCAELLRVLRKWQGTAARLPLAAALAAAAGTFLFHAQHDSAAPMALLVTQHRMIAATLAVAVVAVLSGASGSQTGTGRPSALSLLMLVLALQLLIYNETASTVHGADSAHSAGGAA